MHLRIEQHLRKSWQHCQYQQPSLQLQTTVLSCCKTSETVFMRNSILGSLGGRSSEPRGNEADVPYIPLRSKIFELVLRDSVTERDPR